MALENPPPGAASAQLCIKLSITWAIPVAITRASPMAHNLAILLAIPTTFAVA
jgi:hypothetical protein